MSKNNKPKKVIDPNVVTESLETSSDEVLTNETVEEVVEVKEEAPVVEAFAEPVVEEKKEEEPVPVPLEPGPVIIEEDPKEEKPEEPVPVPVEPGPVIIEEPKVEAPAEPEPVKEAVEVSKAAESSQFAGKYVLCIYATPRKSVDDISDELNTNRRFVADNIIIDRENDRVVLETSDSTEELMKTRKKYLSSGIKTVIDKA